MAMVPMEYEGGAETGTITKTRTGGTLDRTCCYKKGGVVTVAGRIHTLESDNVATGQFFQIPEGFRPNQTTYVAGGLWIGSNVNFVNAEITTDGKVN